MTSTAELRARLREWVLRHGKIAAAELRDDTPLLEERILTSLQVPDLILFLERLRGAPVDVEKLTGAALRNLNAVYDNFLAEVEHGR